MSASVVASGPIDILNEKYDYLNNKINRARKEMVYRKDLASMTKLSLQIVENIRSNIKKELIVKKRNG